MKRIFFLLNTFFVLFQLSFLENIFGIKYVPNLVLSLIIASILSNNLRIAYYNGFLGGLLLDLLGNNLFGMSALYFSTIIFVQNFPLSFYLRSPFVKNVYWFMVILVYFMLIYRTDNLVIFMPKALETVIFAYFLRLFIKKDYEKNSF